MLSRLQEYTLFTRLTSDVYYTFKVYKYTLYTQYTE